MASQVFGNSWDLSDPDQYQYFICYQIFYDYMINTGLLDSNHIYILTAIIERANTIANFQKVVYSHSFIQIVNNAIYNGDYAIVDSNHVRFGRVTYAIV